jgi:hypothetical protein
MDALRLNLLHGAALFLGVADAARCARLGGWRLRREHAKPRGPLPTGSGNLELPAANVKDVW